MLVLYKFYNHENMNNKKISRNIYYYLTLIFIFTIQTISSNSISHAKIIDKDKINYFEEKIKEPQFKIKMSRDDLASDHEASTLVISCVDFRFQDENAYLLNNVLGLLDDYDNIMLPGGSLALASKKYQSWQKSIEEITPLLKKLHKIKRIILLDHRDCGAYGLAFGKDHMSSKEKELKLHKEVMFKAKKFMEKKFPDLKVYCMLMGLDGIVENLSSTDNQKQ